MTLIDFCRYGFMACGVLTIVLMAATLFLTIRA